MLSASSAAAASLGLPQPRTLPGDPFGILVDAARTWLTGKKRTFRFPEGDLTLVFAAEDAPLYELSFSLAPKAADQSAAAMLIVRIQGARGRFAEIRRATLDSGDIAPPHLLVSAAQRARAEAWDFIVRNPQPAVLRVIKLVGLAEHLGLESHGTEQIRYSFGAFVDI